MTLQMRRVVTTGTRAAMSLACSSVSTPSHGTCMSSAAPASTASTASWGLAMWT
ncbi:MAG: hypothetical protein QM765_41390 [Myxococcales bacterium]